MNKKYFYKINQLEKENKRLKLEIKALKEENEKLKKGKKLTVNQILEDFNI